MNFELSHEEPARACFRLRDAHEAARSGRSGYTRALMLKVGGEVDAFCTRCELKLAHTIHALVSGRPVKVECNTCHALHRFRDPLPGGGASGRTAGARAARPARERPAVVPFDELLAAKKARAAQPYSPKKRFGVDDVIDHPIFGLGFVSGVRDGDKVEITFRSDVKILVHGRS